MLNAKKRTKKPAREVTTHLLANRAARAATAHVKRTPPAKYIQQRLTALAAAFQSLRQRVVDYQIARRAS